MISEFIAVYFPVNLIISIPSKSNNTMLKIFLPGKTNKEF